MTSALLTCMHMCEMLSDIYQLVVTAFLIMNMQQKTLDTYPELKIIIEYDLNTCHSIYVKS